MISIETGNYLPYFYVNSLSGNQKKFLEKSDHRGLSNPSQTRKDITDQLAKSFKWIYHVLEHRKNLKQQELYEIFNALNLFGFIRNLLLKPTQEHYSEGFSYDFRTSEIARMMFDMSTSYLSYSKQYLNDPYVRDNIDRLSKSFQSLSNSTLDKEDSTKTIDYEEEMKLQQLIWDLVDKDIYDPAEIPLGVKETENDMIQSMLNHMVELNFEHDEIKNSKTKNKNSMLKKNRNEFNEMKNRWKSIRTLRTQRYHGESEIILIKQRLQKKYDHISAYFARIKNLKDTPELPLGLGEDIANKSMVFRHYD